MDEQTQIAAVMTVEDYKADVNTNDFRTVTLEGTFQRPINPLWGFNMDAGVLRSDYTVVDVLNRATSGATTDYVVDGRVQEALRADEHQLRSGQKRISELQRLCQS